MEQFNLADFLAKLGKAYLSQNNNEEQPKTFKKSETKKAESPNLPKSHTQSNSEKAIVEMLRRHDLKAKEIAERNNEQNKKNS